MRITRITLFSLLIATSAQAAVTWQETSSRFWQALEARDQPAIRKLLTGGVYDDERIVIPSVLSAFDFIAIHEARCVRVHVNGRDAVADIEVDGSGHLRGGSSAPLPAHWTLSFKRTPGSWLIERIDLAESSFAEKLCPDTQCLDEWPAVRDDLSRSVLLRLVIARLKRQAPSLRRGSYFQHAHTLVVSRADAQILWISAAHNSQQLGEWIAARDAACEALRIAYSVGDADMIAAAHRTEAIVSNALSKQERYDEARIARRFSEAGEQRELTAELLLTEGTVASWLGLSTEALRLEERAEAVAMEIDHAEYVAIARFNIAMIYQALGSDDVALHWLRKAYSANPRTSAPNRTSAILISLSDAELRVNNVKEAEVAARKGLEVVGPAASTNRYCGLRSLARACEAAGRYREAEDAIQDAIAVCRRAGGRGNLREALVSAADIFLRTPERLDQAEAFAREAVTVGEPEDLNLIIRAESALGHILYVRGRNAEAKQILLEAVANVETLRRSYPGDDVHLAGFFRGFVTPYQELAAICASEGNDREGLLWSERMRARVIQESAFKERTSERSLSGEETRRRQILNQRLVELNRAAIAARGNPDKNLQRELAAARSELETFEAGMTLGHSTGTAPTDSAQVAIPDRGAFVEYIVLSDQIIACVIRDGVVHLRRLQASPRDAEAKTRKFLARINARSVGNRQDSRALYDQLIAPLASLLPRTGRITIVPDGFLWTVPFHLLRDAKGEYVVEHHSIAYAPSLTMRGPAREPASAARRKTLLALGDPMVAGATREKAAKYRNLHLGLLPDAGDEVRKVALLYGADRSTVLTGESALESVVKRTASEYRVIHLATHGIINDDSPLYSALVLGSAAGDGDDGLLEMREIRELRLNADLVVLSACDTARGRIYPGEGVIGLSWAFLTAGCPTTVVSMWSAESAATAQLMIAFHRHLVAGAEPPEALQRAELELMKNRRYHHPYYWAPFIVVGAR